MIFFGILKNNYYICEIRELIYLHKLDIMKKVLFILLTVAVVSACGENGKENKGKWDPNAMVSLRPAQGVRAGNPEHLSALEIVKQATQLDFWNTNVSPYYPTGRGFADVQRDFVTPKLMMWGTDIIRQDGDLQTDFIEAWDMVLSREIGRDPHTGNSLFDTVGYVPEVVLRAAEARIKAAFADKNYTECYKIFDEAFTFIPITGAEWRELKRQGKN